MAIRRGSFLPIPRDLAVVALGLFTWGWGEGMFLYLQPIYLQSFGAQPVEIGAVLSLVGVAMALAQAPAGVISDRIGARPVLRSAWVIGLLAALLMAAAQSLIVFVAGMLLYGVTSYVTAPLSSYQAHARGNWSVERALTTSGAFYNLGTFLGALTGGWVGSQWGLQNVYRAASIFFAVSTAVIFLARTQKAEDHPVQHAAPQPSLAANTRFLSLLAVIVLSAFALYLPQPLNVLYLTNQQGFSVQEIGQIGAIASLSNAAIMLVLGSLLPARAGLIVGILMVGMFALLTWQGRSAWVFYLGYFFLSGYRLFRAMATAHARTAVRATQTGLAFGLIETGNAAAVIVTPLAAGLLYDRDPRSVYSVSLAAIGAVLLLTIALFNLDRRKTEYNRAATPGDSVQGQPPHSDLDG